MIEVIESRRRAKPKDGRCALCGTRMRENEVVKLVSRDGTQLVGAVYCACGDLYRGFVVHAPLDVA